jgi:hypothetical protein
MKITKIDSGKFPGVSTYEIQGDGTVEPVWYLTVDRVSKVVNLYPIDGDGKINRIDTTVLRFRSDLPTRVARNGVVVFEDPDKLDQYLTDLLGDHASIVLDDLDAEAGEKAKAAMELDLTSDPAPDPGVDLARYDDDLYAGLEPRVVDVIQQAGEGGEEGGEPSGPELGLGPEDFGMAPEGEEEGLPEEPPPEEGEEEEEPK